MNRATEVLLHEGRERQPEIGDQGSATANQANVFRQEGEYWTVTYRGRTARLRDSKGLSCIARLLAQSRCDVHVRDLSEWHRRGNALASPGLVLLEGDLGAVLDAR